MPKPDDKYPRITELVHPSHIKAGVEWAHIQASNIGKFQERGWKLVPHCSSYQVDGVNFVLMSTGKPTRGAIEFMPEVFLDDPKPPEVTG